MAVPCAVIHVDAFLNAAKRQELLPRRGTRFLSMNFPVKLALDKDNKQCHIAVNLLYVAGQQAKKSPNLMDISETNKTQEL